MEEHILETFILVLMESNVEVMSVKISSYLCSYFWGGSSEMQRVITLISWFIAADVAAALWFHGCLVLINMVLNVEHR